MRRRLPIALLGLVLALSSGMPGSAVAAKKPPGVCQDGNMAHCPGVTTIRSRAPGSPSNGHTPARSVPDTTSPAFSLDGLTIAFSSDATNLVPGDSNGVSDVFVRSIKNGKIVRASTNAKDKQANGPSYSPALSVHGDLIAFVSRATNLVPGPQNDRAHVYVKNLKNGAIYRASQTTNGGPGNGDSMHPFVSLFGTWITFDSEASNLLPGDDNGLADAFLHTRKSRKLQRITAPGDNEDRIIHNTAVRTSKATISAYGETLAYERVVVQHDPESPEQATVCAEVPGLTMVPNGPPKGQDACTGIPLASDIYVRWTKVNPKTKVSRKLTNRIAMQAWAGRARKMLQKPVVTADGRYVAYEAWSAVTLSHSTLEARAGLENTWHGIDHQLASNDFPVELGDYPDVDREDYTGLARNPYDARTIYMYDPARKVHWPVSTNNAGVPPNGDCTDAAPNAYGTVIAFACGATNLVPGDTNDAPDVFVRDMPGRVTSRMSVSRTHGEGYGWSLRPSISYEGRRVAFASNVQTFVQGDTNDRDDVFVRDRRHDTANRQPKLTVPFKQPVGIDQLQPFTFRLSAKDPDGDVLRFGAIAGMPTSARLDPVTGEFYWLPGPEDSEPGGKWHDIVFWVGDPRGADHWGVKTVVSLLVRDALGTARCAVLQSNCIPVR